MRDTKFWDERRNIIRSRKGGAIIGGGRVFTHGYSILEELLGNASYFQVLILNITGRLVEERLAKWVEATFVCLSWPDSRIWCNQIGALGGAIRTSPVAAITAGILASDSKLYGPGTMLGATNFITDALKKKKMGASIEEIINCYSRHPGSQPIIPGYSRPLTHGDERIPAMEKISEQLNFNVDEHLELAYEIQNFLFDKFNESMNLSGYMMAFLSDHNFTAKEIYRVYTLCVNNGIHACYAEAYDNPPEAFLPLKCEDIDYKGKPYRPLSRKRALHHNHSEE